MMKINIRERPLQFLLAAAMIFVTVALLSTVHFKYAILPGLGLLVLLLLGRRPQWGYYVIVFFIPLTLIRTLNQSLTFSKLIGMIIVLVVFFYLLLNKKGYFDISSDLWKWLLLFFVINLFSALRSSFPQTAFDGLRMLLIAYLFFLLSMIFIGQESFLSGLPKLIMVSLSLNSLLAIYGYLFSIPSLTIDTEIQTKLKRATGAEIDPNAFSLLVLFGLPLFAHLFFHGRTPQQKRWGALGYLLNIAALITSYSRGGALIFLITLVMTIYVYRDKISVRHLGIASSVIVLLGVAALLAVPFSYWERQLSVGNTQDEAISRRSSYLTFAFEKVWDKPLLGAGTNTFKELYAKSKYTINYTGSEDPRRGAHNTYVEVLIGNGFVGILAFFIIIVVCWRSFNQARRLFLARGQPEAAAMVTTYRLSFIALLLYMFLIHANYHKYFWLSLALSQVALRLATAKEKGPASQAGLLKT